MEIVRAVRADDLQALTDLIGKATYGLTSLQINQSQLWERIERSVFAFHRRSQSPAGEPYVLVMEDGETGNLIGTSTVYAKTGGYEPMYVYKLQTETQQCSHVTDVQARHRTLHLQRIYDGPSEIGSLFLLRRFRGHGRGRFLSLARFALLAQRPHRFAEVVIAQLRGRCDSQGNSPFWEFVMRPFFKMTFSQADALSTVSKTFIEQLAPRYPLYLDLLPRAARDVVGAVHGETLPAMKLLSAEGFLTTDQIDIFDAGPVMACPVAQIKAVQRCRRYVVKQTTEQLNQPVHMISTTDGGFRAILAPATIQGDTVVLHKTDAERARIGSTSEAWVMGMTAVSTIQ